MDRLSTRMKRPFDVVGAIGGLLFFAPVMAAIAAAILLVDGRPLLFRQTRLGRGRRPFTILKFRTMRNEEVTAIGRLLRSTGLDELPQLVNVLWGELSAVGPRPLMEADVRRLGWTDPAYDFRWSVLPGLTGLAQVAGARSARHALRLDRSYIARQSLQLDIRLVAWSFAINVLGKTRVQRLISRRADRVPSTSATSPHRASPARPTTGRARPCRDASPPRA
jgi:lipopolysaccharide/colanic/teichoic acid biosynthesis glycosyltransferase